MSDSSSSLSLSSSLPMTILPEPSPTPAPDPPSPSTTLPSQSSFTLPTLSPGSKALLLAQRARRRARRSDQNSSRTTNENAQDTQSDIKEAIQIPSLRKRQGEVEQADAGIDGTVSAEAALTHKQLTAAAALNIESEDVAMDEMLAETGIMLNDQGGEGKVARETVERVKGDGEEDRLVRRWSRLQNEVPEGVKEAEAKVEKLRMELQELVLQQVAIETLKREKIGCLGNGQAGKVTVSLKAE